MADAVNTAASLTQIVGDLSAGYALVQNSRRFIGSLIPRVTVREVHSDEYTITNYPVATGSPASDHYYRNPSVIEIACGWSDSDEGAYPGYVQEVYQELRALADTREVFDVSTGKRFYSNMLLGNITVVTEVDSENALMVTVRLQEVIRSSTQTSSSGDSSENSTDPQQSVGDIDVGGQTLQSPGSGLANFGTNGPINNDFNTGVGATSSNIGESGISAFSGYMGNFGG